MKYSIPYSISYYPIAYILKYCFNIMYMALLIYIDLISINFSFTYIQIYC